MLDARRDDVPAAIRIRARHAENREVVRLRGAGGEDDLARLRADERRDLCARGFDARLGAPAERMRGGDGVAESAPRASASLIARATAGSTGVVAA